MMPLRADLTNKRHVYPLLCTAYICAFGLCLVNTGIYWDDWVLYGQSSSAILDMFTQASGVAGYVPYYVHIALLYLPHSIYMYHMFTFILYLLSGLLLYAIIDCSDIIDSTDRVFIVLMFILLPFNTARIALICFMYSLSYCMFFLACYIYIKYNMYIIVRLMALLVFSLSFMTNSIVLFYVLFLIYVFHAEGKRDHCCVSLIKTVRKHADIFMLPLVFCFIRALFFTSSGAYSGYNNISFDMIAGCSYETFMRIVVESFTGLMNVSLIMSAHVLIILFLMLISAHMSTDESRLKSDKDDSLLLLFGLFAFVVAIYPYVVVGREPAFTDWASRHQLLMPLGASFALYYGAKIICARLSVHKNIFIIINMLLICTLIIANVRIQIAFIKDGYKQASLIHHIADNTIMRTNTTFILCDNMERYNVNNRTYRFYEIAGWMKYIYHEQTRFAVLEEEYERYKSISAMEPLFNELTNMANYKPRDFEYHVIIGQGDLSLSARNCLKLIYYQYFEPKKFEEQIRKIIKLEFQKT